MGTRTQWYYTKWNSAWASQEGGKDMTNRTRTLPGSIPEQSRYKCKTKHLIERCKHGQWKTCEKWKTSQICLEGPNDRYVQFINTLDRKCCRLLVGLLMGARYANLKYMPHKMGRKKSLSCRKCGLRVLHDRKGEELNPLQGSDITRPDKRSEAERRRWSQVTGRGYRATPWNKCLDLEGNGVKSLSLNLERIRLQKHNLKKYSVPRE